MVTLEFISKYHGQLVTLRYSRKVDALSFARTYGLVYFVIIED